MITKTKLVLGAATVTITMASALLSTEAMAHSKKTHKASSSSYSAAEAMNRKAEMLEAQMQAMQQEIESLRAQVNAPRQDPEAAKVQELDQWMAEQKSKEAAPKPKDNMVSFRGGYQHYDRQRGGTLDPTKVPAAGLENRNGTLVGPISDSDAYYFGAGLDFSLSDNLFGLMNNTEILAEVLLTYSELSNKKNNGLSAQEVTAYNGAVDALQLGAAGYGKLIPANTTTATVNQLTIDASPKIKFMKGSKFRPWLIPIGFEMNIISPPSDAITVLTPGMMFGAGMDYKIWKDIYVGADVRYHYAPSSVDGVDTNSLTAGGYIGIGF